VLSDGQPGHFNQSRGLVAALARIRPLQVHWLDLSLRVGLARNMMRFLLNRGSTLPSTERLRWFYHLPVLPDEPCDLIVSTGGKTSFANAWLAKSLGAKNIFAGSLRRLNPTLFDVVVTLEALQPVSPRSLVLDLPPSPIQTDDLARHGQGLRDALGLGDEKLWTLMIGGDGAGYRYHEADWQQLARLLGELSQLHHRRWLLLGSRRTGRVAERLLQATSDTGYVAAAYWYGSGEDHQVQACLGAAERVFVTEDSMTMLTEAIYAQRPVISLRPLTAAPTRFYTDLIARFEQHGWLARYTLEDLATAPQHLGDYPGQVLTTSPLDTLAAQLAERLQLA